MNMDKQMRVVVEGNVSDAAASAAAYGLYFVRAPSFTSKETIGVVATNSGREKFLESRVRAWFNGSNIQPGALLWWWWDDR